MKYTCWCWKWGQTEIETSDIRSWMKTIQLLQHISWAYGIKTGNIWIPIPLQPYCNHIQILKWHSVIAAATPAGYWYSVVLLKDWLKKCLISEFWTHQIIHICTFCMDIRLEASLLLFHVLYTDTAQSRSGAELRFLLVLQTLHHCCYLINSFWDSYKLSYSLSPKFGLHLLNENILNSTAIVSLLFLTLKYVLSECVACFCVQVFWSSLVWLWDWLVSEV